MTFKNQAEIFQALLEGKTITCDEGASRLSLKNGDFWNGKSKCEAFFGNPKQWHLCDEPEKLEAR